MNALHRVHAECRRWGVPLLVIGSSKPRDSGAWCLGPDHGGIIWPDTIVMFRRDLRAVDVAESIIHELAHVLHGVHPNDADEIASPMLAIEHEAHMRLRLAWVAHMRYFNGPQDTRWWCIQSYERREILQASRLEAERVGLMRDGKPTYRRA